MKKIILLFAIVMAFAATSTFAQQEKGDKVINANINYTKQKDQDGTLNLNVKLGKFFTQNLEVGITPNITIGGGSTIIFGGAYGNYSFLTEGSKTVPYVGANLGIVSIEFTGLEASSGLYYGLNAGLRYFFAEKAFVDGGLAYNAFSLNGTSSNSIGLNLGLGVIIGSVK